MREAEILEEGNERLVGGAEEVRSCLVRQHGFHAEAQPDEIGGDGGAGSPRTDGHGNRGLRPCGAGPKKAGTEQGRNRFHVNSFSLNVTTEGPPREGTQPTTCCRPRALTRRTD